MTVLIITPLQLDLPRTLVAQGCLIEDASARTRVPAITLRRAIEAARADDLAAWRGLGAKQAR